MGDDSEGVINVKENDGNGVWTSRADKAVGLTIQSASITGGCNQIVVGVPSYNDTGIDAGMVRVYNVQPKELIPFGNDIFGEEGYRTGDSVSISNTGKILAVGSPKYSFEDNIQCGKVQILQSVSTSVLWEPL